MPYEFHSGRKMLWGVREPCIGCASTGHWLFLFLMLRWELLLAGWLNLHPLWHSYLHSSLGVNMHLHPTLSPFLRPQRLQGSYYRRIFGQWANRKKETSAPVPHQFENCSPSLYSSKVKFPLGAVRELKVTESLQFIAPWRGSQAAKWKWDCFHIRPLDWRTGFKQSEFAVSLCT